MSTNGISFTTSDGCRLVYDDEGDGDPVVLVHGYSGHREHWHFQRQDLLDSGYRVVTIDQRHHGQSDHPEFGHRMSRLGQDLHELLDQLDRQNVTLIGHSMGASVSMAMFSLYGTQRVAKFVAIDQSPKITNDETWRWGVRKVEWENVWDAVNFRFSWGNLELEPPVPDAVQQALPGQDVNFGDYPHARVRRLFLDHFVADWRDVLPRIDVPTWVVTGRHSPFYDLEGMEWFASEVQNGSLSIFEQSGHSPHLNEAAEFNKQLIEFLRR